ncbi:endo-1,4-beta-xylanase [Chitinophaga sp. 22620]|uniref:endo-1,4-beta-xylanase n=1 Tax=Chitinophaga sp. 22620 TaxID=3453952 RepID=UPI003F87A50C
MKKYSLIVLLLSIGLACCVSTGGRKMPGSGKTPSLKDVFKGDFVIGVALNRTQIEERDSAAAVFIPRQFNAFTPENGMKAALLHPQWDTYNFAEADKIIAYGRKHRMQINGHTLIWHSQLPSFVLRIKDKDSLRRFFAEHISTIASRYDGQVYSWDVVNEALNEDGTLRRSVFREKLGEDYVVEAFRLAQLAAPNTRLYYNDYNIERPWKRAGALALIKKIQAAGVRIDGVGIQGHWHINNLPLEDIEQSILEFSSLGVKVMFTELDISVLPDPAHANGADISRNLAFNAALNPYTNGLPDSLQSRLAGSYEELFRLFLKHKDKIGRITFWGVNDRYSWLNNWPVRGRTNYPMLFDRQFDPKPAFYKVIAVKAGNAVRKQ